MNFHAIRAIYGFEMARTLRTVTQSIVSPVLSTSLYFVVFGAALGSREGQIIVFFVIAIAAAEAAVGLAIFVALFRHTETIDVNKINLLKW